MPELPDITVCLECLAPRVQVVGCVERNLSGAPACPKPSEDAPKRGTGPGIGALRWAPVAFDIEYLDDSRLSAGSRARLAAALLPFSPVIRE
jgi:hypothetical protein